MKLSLATLAVLGLLSSCSGTNGGTSAHTDPAPDERPADPTETGDDDVMPTEDEPTEEPVATPEPVEEPPPPVEPTPPAGSGWFASPRSEARIFASGHSLIDGVFEPPAVNGGPITRLARSAGKTHHAEFQGAPGSTARARRQDIEAGRFRAPRWEAFDTLIVTERADPHSTVIFEETLDQVGWFVDRVRGAPPGDDAIFLYQGWWGFSDDNAPTLRTWPAWAAYVREELPLYECIAQAVGHRRGVTVNVLPAALALAALMEAVDAGRVPGVGPYDVFARDNVHLASLGNTYLALVVFASVYHTPTTGLELPGVATPARDALQALADRTVLEYYARPPAHTVASCRETLSRLCRRHDNGCDYYREQAFPNGSL